MASEAPANETTENDGPEGWRPKTGDVLEGKLRELDQGWSDYQNAYYPILLMEKADGSFVRVHAFHQALRNRLESIRPKIGDRLKITCNGKKATKDGKREVMVYTVNAPDRVQDSATYWDRIAPDSQAPPASAATEAEDDKGDIPW